MGIGTKIKEALHGDKDTHRAPADTSKTPGSFPSDEVPRSHNRNDTHGSNVLGSTAEPRTEKLPGRTSPEYTHGSNAGPNVGATSGLTGRHDHDISASQQDPALARKGVIGGSHTSTGNKLTKEHSDPYWGESDRAARKDSGLEEGAYDRSGNDLHAREVNERYNNSGHHDGLSHAGTAGRTSGHTSGRNDNLTGTTGAYGSGASEGSHGPHSSRVANAADPRVDSDRDHRGAPGSSAYSSGTHGQNARYDTPGAAQASTTTTTGTTSHLTHRPYDNNSSRRDEKINEYNAPTNSSNTGHGLGGTGAGLAGGAAAGYGASKLADRHHEHDLRNNDPSYDFPRSSNAYSNAGSQHHLSSGGSGLDDPHAFNTATKPGTGVGTSMLDPSGTSSGHHAGNRTGHETSTGYGSASNVHNSHGTHHDGKGHGASSGLGAGSSFQDTYDQRQAPSSGLGSGISSGITGSEHASGHNGGNGLTRGSNTEPYGQDHSLSGGAGNNTQDNFGRQSGTHDSGYGRAGNVSGGSSQYSHEGAGASSGHFGPGHQQAKVLHKCDHCGKDNDISRHFRQDAVYRMG